MEILRHPEIGLDDFALVSEEAIVEALRLIVAGDLTEGVTYQFPTEQGLNGGVLCIASDEAQAALDESFVALASFDEALYDELGAISAAAYGG